MKAAQPTVLMHPLIADIGAFLADLNYETVRPVGCHLPPSAIKRLSAQFSIPPSGHGWRTERAVPRLHFIHVLCLAAGLIAVAGGQLKPTPQAAHWLTRTPAHQIADLRRTFAQNVNFAELWHRHRLPGWHLATPALNWSGLVQAIAQTKHRLPGLAQLVHLIPITLISNNPDAQPQALARAIQAGLGWLAEPRRRYHALLEFIVEGAAKSEAHGYVMPLVNPTLSALFGLSQYTQLHISTQSITQSVHTYTYHLSAARVQRALAHGTPLLHITAFLEGVLAEPLPYGLLRQLKRWDAQLRQASLHTVTLLEVRDPALLNTLMQQRNIRTCVQRTVSPRAVVVREGSAQTLLKRLQQRRVQPMVQLPSLIATPPNSPIIAPPLLDSATLQQLYLAAQLTHHLADQLPAPWRTPYSIIEALRAHLTPRQLALTDQAVRAGLADLQPSHADRDESSNPAPYTKPAPVLFQKIEQAIALGQSLTIAYTPVASHTASHRVIEPLRLEWRDDLAYVIAYCHLAQDERIFRADRIEVIGD